jgi:hypothetical protein
VLQPNLQKMVCPLRVVVIVLSALVAIVAMMYTFRDENDGPMIGEKVRRLRCGGTCLGTTRARTLLCHC